MEAANPHSSANGIGGRRGRSTSRRLAKIIVAVPLLALAAMVAGFLCFTSAIASKETQFDTTADGIVVLTGGASRIDDAVELLASGRGQRLLITGVAPTTNIADLAHRLPEREHWFGCCVDLDYSAINTIGNAVETRRWVLDRGFRSIVVVTSSYHMPRAMLEIGHRLPGVTLIPFPVVTEQRRAEPWWTSTASAKVLVSEYLKYIVAAARIGFDQPPGPTETAYRSRARI
jgi:uncharacterized SAM-binding protein YcdF (DUF218 family)